MMAYRHLNDRSCVVSTHRDKLSNNFDNRTNKRSGETTSLSTMKDCESDKNKQMRKESRRPEIEIYKPGMGLRKKNCQKSNCNINSTKDHNEKTNSVHCYFNHNGKKMGDSNERVSVNLQKDKSSLENECSRKSKSKRPDLPVYTAPKNRMVAMQDNKKQGEIKTLEMPSNKIEKYQTHYDSIVPIDQALASKRYSQTGYKKHRTANPNNQISLQEDCKFERKIFSRHQHSNTVADRQKNESNSTNTMHRNFDKNPSFVKNGLNNNNYVLEDTDESSETLDNHVSRKIKAENIKGFRNNPHRLPREDYYTSFTSHVTQEENWDTHLIPFENLCISTKTFSQEDSYIADNSKDCLEEKHTELQSELSDGEQSEALIGTKIITPSMRSPIKISHDKMHNCENEQHATSVENQVELSSTELNSFLYSPMIRDWSEEVEASEMKMKPVSDAQCTNIPDQDKKEGKKMKREVDDYKTKQEISQSKSHITRHNICTQEYNSTKYFNKRHTDCARDKKLEKDIPPRFQKVNRRIDSLDEKSNDVKSGGIIRIPSETCDMDESLHPSTPTMNYNVCPEQACIVQKQLYDPNNPDKPVIVMKQQPLIFPPKLHLNVDPYGMAQFPLISSIQDQLGCIDVPSMSPVITAPTAFAYSISPSYPPPPSTPVLSSCYSDHLQQDTQNRRIKPLVKKNLRDIRVLERELASHLSKGINKCDMKAVGQCRWKLQLRYENIILADPRHCAEQNIEQSLWKSVFYQVIEALRRQMDEDIEKKEDARQSLINCVDEGTVFYENLLEKQQETFGFNLAHYLDNVARPQRVPDSVRLVLISVQKIYIYLGDLARYREQANNTSNYGKARSWYLQAQQLAPKNGRPYNQLAILAVYTRRKLDAVYYYMRSLAASNPFLTARESLLSLFEDARKKYEQAEKKRCEEKINYLDEKVKSEREERYEVWIHPDGSSSKRTSKTEQDPAKDELSQMDTFDLNKRFVTSFLHALGKLFNKIGMETFKETATHMLMEFNSLLQRTPPPMGPLRLLQLLVINMFSIANTSLKDQNLESQGWSPLQELAVQLNFTMVTLLLERTVILLKEHFQSGDYPANFISEDLAPLLPAIKVWTDWMSCQHPLWYPTPPPCNFKIGCKEDVWTAFAALLTILRTVDTSGVEIISEPQEGYELVTLPEDTTLAGFVPLLGAPEDSFYVKIPFDQERAKHCLRISRIQFFGDYLCGIPSPYLEFDVEKKMFISLVSDISSEENTESGQDICCDLSDDDVTEDVFDEDDGSKGKLSGMKGQEENDIQMLWSRKEALRKTKAQQDRYRAKVQAVLQEHRHKRPTMLEIRPRYLIPDTNCFIDHLDGLKSLVNSIYFVLVVPIVVINELDGLARGTRESLYTSSAHVKKVAQLSRDAVQFLEERFSVRDSKVKAITSKGSTLDTITFRSEDVSDNKGTNDDLILSCCLHYSKDKKDTIIENEGPVRLIREAVLLTEDKNLRVKALAHNVPVRDLPEFLKWANIR